MSNSGRFRPEFLARITEIIPFAPITESIAERIFNIQLKSLHTSLTRLGIALKISDDAVKILLWEDSAVNTEPDRFPE
jgi:ATP-dependent Clp protease ATP-binding subunit ClpA